MSEVNTTQRFAGRDVLVTGATGFTGLALTRRLVSEGAKVCAFVRASSHTEPLTRIGVDCQVVDITDSRSVDGAFRPFDRVFHIAAEYRVEHADRSVFQKVNVEATGHLLEAAARHGVGRFVHCSTVGVHGQIDDPPADETYRFAPRDHYQETKLAGEEKARAAFAAGLPGVVVRPMGIYGPGDHRFLKLFRAIDRGVFVMIGSGKTLYHFAYIDDLVKGFLLASESAAALGDVFIVAGEEWVELRDLVNMIADILGKRHPRLRVPLAPVHAAAVVCEAICKPLRIAPPLFPRRVEFFCVDRAFSIAKARRVLGFEPRVSLHEGLQRTADWYRAQGLI